jgi:tetratricopeptide (TPR) repeat protein
MGHVALQEGDYAQAIAKFEEQLTLALAYSQETGYPSMEAWWAQIDLGLVARLQGDYRTATQRLEEAIKSSQRAGSDSDLAFVELQLGYIQLAQQDQASAFIQFRDSIRLCYSADNKPRLILALAAVAELRQVQGDAVRSVQLCGFAEKFQRAVRAELLPAFLSDYERILSIAHAQLDDPKFAAAWAEGQMMTLDEAVELALSSHE